jgi:hypothetical protein
MYVVKGAHWLVRNGVKQPPQPDREFITAMGMLRWAMDTGMIRRRGAWGNTVPGADEMERVSIPYAGSNDWDSFKTGYYFSVEQVAAMGAALSRYRAILHHFREIEPEWTQVAQTNYADNSTEVREVNKYGATRTRMTVSPSGDACF